MMVNSRSWSSISASAWSQDTSGCAVAGVVAASPARTSSRRFKV
jgi:hypothetical protein